MWPKVRNRKKKRNDNEISDEKIKWGKDETVVLNSFSELIKEDIVKSISKKFEQNLVEFGKRKKYLKNIKGLRKNDNLISLYEASRGRTSLFLAFFFRKRNIQKWVKKRELGLKVFMQDV